MEPVSLEITAIPPMHDEASLPKPVELTVIAGKGIVSFGEALEIDKFKEWYRSENRKFANTMCKRKNAQKLRDFGILDDDQLYVIEKDYQEQKLLEWCGENVGYFGLFRENLCQQRVRDHLEGFYQEEWRRFPSAQFRYFVLQIFLDRQGVVPDEAMKFALEMDVYIHAAVKTMVARFITDSRTYSRPDVPDYISWRDLIDIGSFDPVFEGVPEVVLQLLGLYRLVWYFASQTRFGSDMTEPLICRWINAEARPILSQCAAEVLENLVGQPWPEKPQLLNHYDFELQLREKEKQEKIAAITQQVHAAESENAVELPNNYKQVSETHDADMEPQDDEKRLSREQTIQKVFEDQAVLAKKAVAPTVESWLLPHKVQEKFTKSDRKKRSCVGVAAPFNRNEKGK